MDVTARGWVSFNLGTGEKSDYAVIAEWLAALAKMECKAHPAPWARLERQFLIKLTGEDKPARAVSNKGDVNEFRMVADFAKRLGRVADDDHDNGRGVDELMSRAVRIATVGLKRHGRRAKIAWALDPNRTSIFGMGGSETAFTPGDEKQVKLLTAVLFGTSPNMRTACSMGTARPGSSRSSFACSKTSTWCGYNPTLRSK